MSRPTPSAAQLSLAAAVVWLGSLFVAWAILAPASALRALIVLGSVVAFLRVGLAIADWLERTGMEKARQRLRDRGEL
jgi:hypothetical protein